MDITLSCKDFGQFDVVVVGGGLLSPRRHQGAALHHTEITVPAFGIVILLQQKPHIRVLSGFT